MEDGEYGLFVEDYEVSPPVSVLVVDQQDALDVTIQACEPETPPELTDIPDDQRGPMLCADGSDQVWLLWSQGSRVRWAYWNGEAWVDGGLGPETAIPVAAFGYDDNIGGEPGLFAAWEHLDAEADRTVLNAAFARVEGTSLVWSEACPVSGSAYDNVLPSAIGTDDGLLVVWLQYDPALWDDADGITVDMMKPASSLSIRAKPLPVQAFGGKAEACTDLRLKQEPTPTKIPIIGGNHKFEIRASLCGDRCDNRNRGSVSMAVDWQKQRERFREYICFVGNQCKPSSWVFKQASLSVTAGLTGTFEAPVLIAGVPGPSTRVGTRVRWRHPPVEE